MIQIWKDIKGYEGQYQISNFGNCRSLDRFIEYYQTNQYNKPKKVKLFIKGFELKPRKTKHDYFRFQLNNKDFYAHRLVASAFLGIIKPKEEINHIDGNKQNNKYDNLEIVSRHKNHDHAIENKLNITSNFCKKVIIDNVVYDSEGQAMKTLSISRFKLRKILSKV